MQTRWSTDAKERPLFLFRQLGPKLKILQWRRPSAQQARCAAAVLTVQIPERFCSLTVADGAARPAPAPHSCPIRLKRGC